MLGFPILYLKGMRIMMFQLSGFYCRPPNQSVAQTTEAWHTTDVSALTGLPPTVKLSLSGKVW